MDFHKIWTDAFIAGEAAAKACTPKPMTIVQVNPITDEVIKTYEPIADGMCGFAWVKIRPANSAFARWLKDNNIGHKAYDGGWDVSIQLYSQSWERKYAHAKATAEVLKAAGINAIAYERLD
jgi:hypothetical protein